MTRGQVAESATAGLMQATYWPVAERRTKNGNKDRGDINPGVKGLCIEVKADANPSFSAHLREVESERINAGAEIGVVIYQPPGIGIMNVDKWWGVMAWETYRSLASEHITHDVAYPTLMEAPEWRRLTIKTWLKDAAAGGCRGIKVKSRGADNPDWVILPVGTMFDWLDACGYGGIK